jgi:hypothetical protein
MSGPDVTVRFMTEHPSLDSFWRAIVLFGRNVASYKFALARALVDVNAEGQELVSLESLALPFALQICEHLRTSDRQGTFQQSRFLDACRAFNRGDATEDELRARTVELGFNNVIDAFHVVDRTEIPERFFVDERQTAKGIRLTDNLRRLLETDDVSGELVHEVEARWRLVETAWALNLPRQLLTVDYEPSGEMLLVPRRRIEITRARDALNGYQKSHCFYCYRPITLRPGSPDVCNVDHVFAWSTGPLVAGAPIDGVWNLVLACPACNSWHEKSDRPPDLRYVERLERRNEYLIASSHPLRPTLIAQTGATPSARHHFLTRAYNEVTLSGARVPWTSPAEEPSAF